MHQQLFAYHLHCIRYNSRDDLMDFPGGSAIKNLPASAGDTGLIPGSGRALGEGTTLCSILAWEIPWTEEPGGLQSMGSQKSWT